MKNHNNKNKEVSPSLENYIETIYFMNTDDGVRVTDVALDMCVSKASVIKAVKQLKNMEIVTQKHYGGIILTQKGKEYGEEIAQRHEMLFDFFKYIGVEENLAEEEACIVEHQISKETIQKIDNFLQKIKKYDK